MNDYGSTATRRPTRGVDERVAGGCEARSRPTPGRLTVIAAWMCLVAAPAAIWPAAGAAQELMGTRIVAPGDLRVATGPEGTIRTYFDAPTSTLLNLGLRSSTLEPGETPHPTRPHTRPTESLLLVEAGTLHVRIGEETQDVPAGAAVLLGPNQWHELRNTSGAPVTFYEFAWTSPGMNGEPDYPEEAVNWRRRPRQ